MCEGGVGVRGWGGCARVGWVCEGGVGVRGWGGCARVGLVSDVGLVRGGPAVVLISHYPWMAEILGTPVDSPTKLSGSA